MKTNKLKQVANLFHKYATWNEDDAADRADEDDAADRADERILRQQEEDTFWDEEGRKELAKWHKDLQEASKTPEEKEREQEEKQYERKKQYALKEANRAMRMENKHIQFETFDEAAEYFSQFYQDKKDPVKHAMFSLLYASTSWDLADLIRKSEGKKTRLQELSEKYPQETELTEPTLEELAELF